MTRHATLRLLYTLLSTAAASQSAAWPSDDLIAYSVSNTNAMRSNCHSPSRCVQQLNDGKTRPGNTDWLVNGVNSGNLPSRMWVIMDLGANNAGCVGTIGIFNQGEMSNSRREVTSFDLLASDDLSTWVKIVDGATVEVSGTTNPQPERKVATSMCDIKRYIKFVGKTTHNTDGYAGLMEIKLYKAWSGAANDLAAPQLPPGDNSVHHSYGMFQSPPLAVSPSGWQGVVATPPQSALNQATPPADDSCNQWTDMAAEVQSSHGLQSGNRQYGAGRIKHCARKSGSKGQAGQNAEFVEGTCTGDCSNVDWQELGISLRQSCGRFNSVHRYCHQTEQPQHIVQQPQTLAQFLA